MNPNSSQQLIQLEDLIPETNVVATLCCDLETFRERNKLEFQESYDDLDFLLFALLPLGENDRVALVYHKHAPVPNIEICVRYDRENIGAAIVKTLDRLNFTSEDLNWIHPQYEREFSHIIKPVNWALSTNTLPI